MTNILNTIRKMSRLVDAPPYKLHARWLRDNCQCAKCVHPSTKQKLHSSGKIQVDIQPQRVEVIGKDLKVNWIDGHESIYTYKWLAHHSVPFKPLISSPISWNRKIYTNKFEKVQFSDFMTDQGYRRVLGQIRDYGLAFLTNVPSEEHIVESVAEKFGVIRDSFYGRSWNVKNDPQSVNIAYTSLELGLHMDLLYFEAPPGLQLLHCLENSVTGGESIFSDAFRSVDVLRKDHKAEYKILSTIPVLYHYKNDGRHFEYQHITIQEDINDGYHIYYSPPFQGPLRASHTDLTDFYQAFTVFESLLEEKDNQFEYLMQPGDLALFANRRVLHGRQAFDPSTGDRWLRGSYVEWDSVKDKIRST